MSWLSIKTELAKGSAGSQFQRIQNVNASNSWGYPYLMAAVMQYKADIVKLLLEAGAAPNLGRKDGVRPLAAVFLKRMEDREKIIRPLIGYGAAPPQRISRGRPPLTLRKSRGRNRI